MFSFAFHLSLNRFLMFLWLSPVLSFVFPWFSLFFVGPSLVLAWLLLVFLWFSCVFLCFSFVFEPIALVFLGIKQRRIKPQYCPTKCIVYVEKGMLSSLSPARVQNTANRKIFRFEAHMQEKMQFTAYLRGFVNIQDPRHLKTGILFSLQNVIFIIQGGEMRNFQEADPEVPVFFKEALDGKSRISTVQFPKFTM